MKTVNISSFKKLVPILILAATFLFIILVLYYIFARNSIEKNGKNDFFWRNQELPAQPEQEETPPPAPIKRTAIALPENLEIPDCPETFSDADDHEIVRHKAYSICYRESFEQAEYSAYMLDEGELLKNVSRKDNFRPDPSVSTKSASQHDYRSSGYDRGHLSPAGDFVSDEEAMSESFFMSNMSPQAPGLNRGIWKDLETSVRNWAKNYGRVYVISGPILEKDANDYEKIGIYSIVAVPEYFYKVILIPLYADENDKATPDDTSEAVALAFIFPNEKCSGSIWDFQVTVDEVENRTGLNFFSKLDKTVEEKIESEKTFLEAEY